MMHLWRHSFGSAREALAASSEPVLHGLPWVLFEYPLSTYVEARLDQHT